MGRAFKTLGVDDIQRINLECIEKDGGMWIEADANFHNRASLEYIIEAVVFPFFGQDAYPGIFRKIAAIVRSIVLSHVFHDGNKRTAMATMVGLLAMNGYALNVNEETMNFIIRVAAESLELADVESWIKQHSKIAPSAMEGA